MEKREKKDGIVGLFFSVGECNRPHISHNSVFVSTKLNRWLAFPSAIALVQSRAKVSNTQNSGDFVTGVVLEHGRSRRVANELRNRRRSTNSRSAV